ncbi:hypothetical protein [Rhodanobacter sp. UC4436_H3]
MEEDELTALAATLSVVISRFEQRCQRIEAQQGELLQHLPAMLQDKVDGVLQTLSGQAGVAVREGLGAPAEHYRQRVQVAAAEAEQATRALASVQAEMASQRRWMRWGLGAVLALSLISLAATYESLYGFYQARYARLRAQVTYLEAVNHADVVPCGDGRLCARVEHNSPRYGERKQYRVVAPRP